VHHPQHGVGKIESIRERSLYGTQPATYAEVYFEREDLTLTLQKDRLADEVRTLISANKSRQLLKELQAWSKKPSKQWKARANAHQAAIATGDPFEYAKVYKELSGLDADDALRTGDRQHFKQTEALLVEELASALGKSRRKALAMLHEAAST